MQDINKGFYTIGGHDYSMGWKPVLDAVNYKLGEPNHIFVDTSWLKVLPK